MSTDILFGMRERLAGSVESSGAFPLGGRTRWTTELRVARIAGSLTVVHEVSSTADDGDWITVATFGPITTTGKTTLEGTGEAGGAGQYGILITDRDVYHRGRITQCTGDVVFDLAASAPVIDWNHPPDLAILTKELRSWGDGVERMLREAELDVLRLLVRRPALLQRGADGYAPEIVSSGDPADYEAAAGQPAGLVWDCNPTLPGFAEALRLEIATQAEHLFQKEKLRRSSEPSSLVTWREMGPLAPQLGRRLEPYRPTGRTIWRGR